MLQSEKKSLIRFLTIYLSSTFVLFSLASGIFYLYSKHNILDHQLESLKYESEHLKQRLRELDSCIKNQNEFSQLVADIINSLDFEDPDTKEKEEKKGEEINIDLVISNVERLIKQENFEQALAILNEVKSKNEDIERLKNQAIEGIINRERNKAAKLFLLAKETEQKEKKLKYLEQSYRILEALIIQYPDSPLISRVRKNLEKVAEEIKNLNIKTP